MGSEQRNGQEVELLAVYVCKYCMLVVVNKEALMLDSRRANACTASLEMKEAAALSSRLQQQKAAFKRQANLIPQI